MATRAKTPLEAPAEGHPAGFEALADAVAALGDGSPSDAPTRLLAGVGQALAADVAILTVPTDDGAAVRAVWAASPAVAAQLYGARTALVLRDEEQHHVSGLTAPVRAVAERLRADAVLSVPVGTGTRCLGVLELVRGGQAFDSTDRAYVRLVASAAAVALGRDREHPDGDGALLALVTDALAAAAAERADGPVAELALQLAGARGALVWRFPPGGPPERAAAAGDTAGLAGLEELAASAAASTEPLVLDELGGRRVVSLPVGRPAWLVLQLVNAPGELVESRGDALLAFAARAGATVRVAERRSAVATELERTRGLLEVVAEANADLSVAQTIDPTLERITDLLEIDRGAIYLREAGVLRAAAVRGVGGEHETIGERLLELALGPQGGPGTLVVDDALRDARFAGLRAELESAQVEAAVAAPLVLADGVAGLLVLFPPRHRRLTDDERALLRGVAAQVAVAVQNARLHERATTLGTELEEALLSERQAARQLRALYEISSSFAQSLSLERTVDAVARTVVELAEADVAAIHMPDERGETLVPRALHASEARLAPAVSTLLERPQPLSGLPMRLLRARQSMALDARTAGELELPYELLVPFLEKGATAVVVPIATPTELLGIITVVSLDSGRPLASETADLMLSVARQAALAVDNARLYQQQKAFADTMQRSLLPRENPTVPGLEIGAVYESSARVDVGGDLYDFLELEDGRLALVLGDVTGHGIDAAADMAMAKFTFRSLVRVHEDPADLLAAANDVVCSEIAPGKFITLAALVVDGSTGELRAAAAGHPRPRLVEADGAVRPLDVGGLALGVVPGQEYETEPTAVLPGAAVVLFTDGVIEARREGELFGEERLDTLLTERYALPAQELADAVLDACRSWSGGELADDCAVVVVRRIAD